MQEGSEFGVFSKMPRSNHMICVSKEGLEFVQDTKQVVLTRSQPPPKKLPTVSEEESKGIQESSSRKGAGQRQRFYATGAHSQSNTTLGSPTTKDNAQIPSRNRRRGGKVYLGPLHRVESIDGSTSQHTSNSPKRNQNNTPRSTSKTNMLAAVPAMGALDHLVTVSSPTKSKLKAILKGNQDKMHSKSELNLGVLKSHIVHTLSPDEDSLYVRKKAQNFSHQVEEEEQQQRLKQRIQLLADSPKPSAKDLAKQTTLLTQVKKSPLSKDCIRELMFLQQLKRIKNRCREYDQEYHTVNSQNEEIWTRKTQTKSKLGHVVHELNKICSQIEEIDESIDPTHKFPSYSVQKSLYELPKLPAVEWSNPTKHFRMRTIDSKSLNSSGRKLDLPSFKDEVTTTNVSGPNQSSLMESWKRIQAIYPTGHNNTLDGKLARNSPVRLFRHASGDLEGQQSKLPPTHSGFDRKSPQPKLAGFGGSVKMSVPRRLKKLGPRGRTEWSADEDTHQQSSLFAGSSTHDDRLPTIRETSQA